MSLKTRLYFTGFVTIAIGILVAVASIKLLLFVVIIKLNRFIR
jgi:hypothetical protein